MSFNLIQDQIENALKEAFPYGNLTSGVISVDTKAHYVSEENSSALTDAIQHNFYIDIETEENRGIFFNLIMLEMGENYAIDKLVLDHYNEHGFTHIDDGWSTKIQNIIEQYFKPRKQRYTFQ